MSAARVLKLKLRVLAPDGALTPVDGVLQTSPQTLDELRDAISTHLVALGKLQPGVQVTVDGYNDGFDEEWIDSFELSDLPSRAFIRITVPPTEPYLDRTAAAGPLQESRRLLSEHCAIGCCPDPFAQAAACLRAACSAAFPDVVLTDLQAAVKPVQADDPLNRGHVMTAAAINSWRKAFADAKVDHPGDKEVPQRVAAACVPPGVARCTPIAVPNKKAFNYFLHLEMHASTIEAVHECEKRRQEAKAQMLAALIDPAKLQHAREELKGRARTDRCLPHLMRVHATHSVPRHNHEHAQVEG